MFQEMVAKLFQRKQHEVSDVSDVAQEVAQAGPDLGALLHPGINTQPAQVAVTQNVQEPQEIPEQTPEIILPEESEEQWSARIHAEWFAKEAGLK